METTLTPDEALAEYLAARADDGESADSDATSPTVDVSTPAAQEEAS